MILSAVNSARRSLSDRVWFETLKRHKSRMGFRHAPAYSRYLKQCRKADFELGDIAPEVERAAKDFGRDGFASLQTESTGELANGLMDQLIQDQKEDPTIWDSDGRYSANEAYISFAEMEGFLKGDLGDLYRSIFQADFKIYYSLIYRSINEIAGPSGSQLWHADGGPGTCINTMIYLTDVGPEHGALECLPWSQTLDVFRQERSALRKHNDSNKDQDIRSARADYYQDSLAGQLRSKVVQPVGKAGQIVVFRNNLIHRGGFPDPDVTRYVALFHAYPSHRPTPFERYRAAGAPKRGPYPTDPAEDF